MFDFFSIILIIVVSACGFYFKKERDRYKKTHARILTSNQEMQSAMAHGLYYRFRKPEDGEEKEEDPLDFEYFVAEIMEGLYGGTTFVTPSSGDFGVDIEHKRGGSLYLGQVKCEKNPIDYQPIAIIHSQMMKQKAEGGFVVTTSSFTENAYEYVKNLNIELIDGCTLVKYWSNGLEKKLA